VPNVYANLSDFVVAITSTLFPLFAAHLLQRCGLHVMEIDETLTHERIHFYRP